MKLTKCDIDAIYQQGFNLLGACQCGDLDGVRRLISLGVDVQIFSFGALHISCNSGDIEMLSELIKNVKRIYASSFTFKSAFELLYNRGVAPDCGFGVDVAFKFLAMLSKSEIENIDMRSIVDDFISSNKRTLTKSDIINIFNGYVSHGGGIIFNRPLNDWSRNKKIDVKYIVSVLETESVPSSIEELTCILRIMVINGC